MSNFNNGGAIATLPLTYPDLLCNPDVSPLGIETTSDLQNLIQDVKHILEEDTGSNLDDPLRGVGINNWLSGTSVNLASLTTLIIAQLKDDPRITSVDCSISGPLAGIFPYIINVNINVSGSVIPANFGWNQTGIVLI